MRRATLALETWSPLLVVLMMAMVTAWLWRLVSINLAGDGRTVTHDPDLIMERFTARQFSPLGTVRYTLQALKMVHYPDDDTSHFDTVLFTSLEPDAPTLTIRSDHAVRSEKQDQVDFTGNVIVTREPSPEQPLTVIHTTALTVFPQRGIGQTNQAVRIEYGKDTLLAASMKVNSKTRIAEFSRAKLTHIPPRQH